MTAGLAPATSAVTGPRSVWLSYAIDVSVSKSRALRRAAAKRTTTLCYKDRRPSAGFAQKTGDFVFRRLRPAPPRLAESSGSSLHAGGERFRHLALRTGLYFVEGLQ